VNTPKHVNNTTILLEDVQRRTPIVTAKALTACKTIKACEWVLNKAGVKRELTHTVKARKLAYYGHTMKKTRELPGERDNARNNANTQNHESQNTDAQVTRAPTTTLYVLCGLQEGVRLYLP